MGCQSFCKNKNNSTSKLEPYQTIVWKIKTSNISLVILDVLFLHSPIFFFWLKNAICLDDDLGILGVF